MPCFRCSAFTSLCIHVPVFLVISLCICIFTHKHSGITQNNLLHEQTDTHAQLRQLRALGRNDPQNRSKSGGISRQDDKNLYTTWGECDSSGSGRARTHWMLLSVLLNSF